jgi:DNA gyrase/topoisomerase IV subunit A
MEIQKIIEELAEIQIEIAEYLEILGSDKRLRGIIVQGAEGSAEGVRRRAAHDRSSKIRARFIWKI